MSSSKEFPEWFDFVEPPLKKSGFCEGENSKITESEHLDVGEISKVTELLEHLVVGETSKVTESSEHLDVGEISKVTESSEHLDVGENSKVTVSTENLDVGENSKVTVSTENLDVGENSKPRLDVMSFLSNNGKTNYLVRSNGEFVSLNEIRGKHLIIYSVSLPCACFDEDVPFWRVAKETYPELSEAGFEMVVSVTIKRNNKEEKLCFDKFLSTLPCLAIPFPDLDTRNSVCTFINTNCKGRSYDFFAIVVDPAGLILPYRDVTMLLHDYGFECFTKKVEDIVAEDDVLKMRLDPFYRKTWEQTYINDWPESLNRDILDQPLSLHQDFLLCDPSRVLSRFDNHSLPVSELSKKLVALYLCLDGNFMETLNEVYIQCLENNLELEVVLVCMPYFEEPNLYYDDITAQLKRYDIKSWFIFPFDNKVCFRLKRAFCTQWDVEKVIILPPNCMSSGDLEGRAVLYNMGIEAYPFTRSTVLKQRVTAVKSLTSSSLFKGSREERTCLIRNGKKSKVPHSAIKGRKLILYLDWVDLPADDGELCRLLMKLYPKIRAKGCQVVFVPLDEQVGSRRHARLAKMPWPMMPVKAAIKERVPGQFYYGDEDYLEGNQLIVFGEDGKILSRWNKGTLMKYGITQRLFRNYVREEIYRHLDVLDDEDM